MSMILGASEDIICSETVLIYPLPNRKIQHKRNLSSLPKKLKIICFRAPISAAIKSLWLLNYSKIFTGTRFQPLNSTKQPQILSAAFPSQRGGIFFSVEIGWLRVSKAARFIFSEFVPTSRFVPCEIVTGRSVFSRRVRHGIPSAVVSSCKPPESVKTSFAPEYKFIKSK